MFSSNRHGHDVYLDATFLWQRSDEQPLPFCEYSQNVCTRVGPKVSGVTYKSRAKWKMLRGIYIGIYGEVNVLVSVCVEIKGDCIEKWQICFICVTLKIWSGRKLLDPPS
jgi:hypothetical protein